jgi:hypothetical protein
MVLDELVTNATKYRALSNSPGRVSVAWRWQWKGCRHGKLLLEWQEIGGPPITPNVSGYGTSVIPDLIPYELGGTVDYRLAPACPALSRSDRPVREEAVRAELIAPRWNDFAFLPICRCEACACMTCRLSGSTH